jgi:hypothetical protein
MVKKNQRIKKKIRTKKRREKKHKKQWKNNYQEAQYTLSWTRGLTSSKKRRIITCESYRKISQDIVYGTGMFIFFSLYPKKFG